VKILHVKLARSIWLFDIRDLNPEGKDLMGDLVHWIMETYGFPEGPDPDNPIPNQPPTTAPVQQTAQQASGGLVFKRGHFQNVEISSLAIYDDGIVVDTTSSTADGDLFAEDLLKSAADEFSLPYDTETVRKKMYLSELIVRSDLRLESLNPTLVAFAEKLSSIPVSGQSLSFGVGTVAFWSEPNDAGLHRAFKIERQLGRSFSEHRFYSEAPFQTDAHLRLLEEFEKLVIGA
jgi:hypothetical protein